MYVTAKCQPRFRDSKLYDLKVQNVEYLQSVKEKAIDRITITIKSDLVDQQIVEDLCEIVAEHPGSTKLFFQLRDSSGKNHVLLRSKKATVDVRHDLLTFIESHEDVMNYHIN